MILVKFDFNYADEFDTSGFKIMTQDEFDLMVSNAKDAFIEAAGITQSAYRWKDWDDSTVEHYFGTNEALIFERYDEWIQGISCRHIDYVTASVIEELFGLSSGMCCEP